MSKAQTDIRRTSYDAAAANPNGYVGTLEDALEQVRAQDNIHSSLPSARGLLLEYLGVNRPLWKMSGLQRAAKPEALLDDEWVPQHSVEDDSVEYRDPPPPASLNDQDIGARLDALNDQQMDVYWAARVRVGVREALAYAEAYPYPAVRS